MVPPLTEKVGLGELRMMLAGDVTENKEEGAMFTEQSMSCELRPSRT